MPTPTPVPGQILLTYREMLDLEQGMRNLIPDLPLRKQCIRTMIASLNNWRFGAAAGEIRRSAKGSVAVRNQGADGALGWDIVRLEDADIPEDDGAVIVDTITEWPIIHNESWYDRVTDSDYTKLADANG